MFGIKDLFSKKKTLKLDRKINLVFLVYRPSIFTSVRSVYECAKSHKDINVYIVALPACMEEYADGKQSAEYEEFYRSIDTEMLQAYDKNEDKWLDLSELSPDYIFLPMPYEEYYLKYSFTYLSQIAKLCFVPYGYSCLEQYVHFHFRCKTFLANLSFVFTSSLTEYGIYMRNNSKGARVFNIGYPRFDLLNLKNNTSTDKKQQLKILYLPRFTVEYDKKHFFPEGSSFIEFKENVISWAQQNDDCDFVIRPHPVMFAQAVSMNVMTQEEIDNWKKSVSDSKNMSLDDATISSYIERLLDTDVFISDFSSLLVECFITRKPVIYTGNPDGMIEEVQEMLESFYVVDNWQEVEKILSDLKQGIDPKKELREKAVDNFMQGREYNVGEKIIDLLIEDFQQNSKK